MKGAVRLVSSCPGPKKPLMVERLWVPLIHSLLARNSNCASAGWPLTASRVAKRVGTSTPLRAPRACVLVMLISLLVGSWLMTGTDVKQRVFPRPSRRGSWSELTEEGPEKMRRAFSGHEYSDPHTVPHSPAFRRGRTGGAIRRG